MLLRSLRSLRSLLAVSLLVACSGSFTTREAGTPPPTPAPPAPASVIVETSASGDHGSARVPVWANDPRWGDWDAPVTIVEFGDLECPFTKSVAPTLAALKEQYGPQKLRVVWKHLPLASHDSARSAADAAATVFALGGSEAFWKFQALALANQDDLDDEAYGVWAEAAGVRKDTYVASYGARRFSGKVDDDLELAGKVDADTTPAFRINGVTLAGAASIADFQKVIDGELDKAAKLVAAGARPADVYVTLTNQNAAEPQPAARAAASDEFDDTVWHVPVLPDDPTLGPPDALVTVVEFSDFQCPFCKRVRQTLSDLRDAHPGEVRLVWKDQPLAFHTMARPAAILARAAYDRLGNDGFWGAEAALFESQPSLSTTEFERISGELGLSWPVVSAAIKKNVSKKIDESVALAEDVEATGTPYFFLNGVRLSGAQPLEEFEKVFLRRRAAAQALVASGITPSRVYETTIKDGRKARVPDVLSVPAPGKSTPTRGPARAPVVIQEWSDFQCPFCERVQDTLRTLEKEFAGRIKLAWRHNPLPFHKDAALASEAAQEVFEQRGSAAFWRFHDALFAAQKVPDGLGRPRLEALAQKQGVDLGRFRQALDTNKHRSKIAEDLEAAKNAGITGTPTFVINGYKVSGAQPITAFRKVVMLALRELRPVQPKTKMVP